MIRSASRMPRCQERNRSRLRRASRPWLDLVLPVMQAPQTPKARLVSRFRSSYAHAAHSDTNFGIKGTLATLRFQCPFEPEIRNRPRCTIDANFGFEGTAPGAGFI